VKQVQGITFAGNTDSNHWVMMDGHFPANGPVLAPPVPAAFVADLRRRGIPFTAGQRLVDADANEAPRILEVIRTLELPLTLTFNRGVMTRAQSVSQATGLHVALETLRLSARNTVAIGDAENDHELLAWLKLASRSRGGARRYKRALTSSWRAADRKLLATM
jgi:hypothetical protein